MSDDINVLSGMLNPAPSSGEMPASLDTGVVTQVVDDYHLKVNLGDKEVTVQVPSNMTGMATVDSGVQIAVQENTRVLTGVLTGATGGGVPVGTVTLYLGATIPDGWLALNGQTYSSTEYPALAAAMDGVLTLPNMADRVPVGISGTKSIRTLGGASSITLTEAQLPSHDHTMAHTHTFAHTHQFDHYHNISHTHTYGYHAEFFLEGGGTQKIVAVAGSPNDSTNAPSTTISASPNTTTTGGASTSTTSASSAANTGLAGSGSAINVQNAYVAFNYIIKAR
jgi:Phage Tail Collar Domain